MVISKEIKERVIDEWKKAFPQLTVYDQKRLLKVIGPVMIGLEFIKLPHSEEYRPHFVIYSLWEKDIKACLNTPVLIIEFYDKKGFQFNIPYADDKFCFDEILESINQQNPISFSADASLNDIMYMLDDYSKKGPLGYAPNSYLQAVLQVIKLKAALFISTTKAEVILEQIKLRDWDISHFKAWGLEVEQWLQNLKKFIHNREDFLNQIEANKRNNKILKLQRSFFTE